MQQIAPDEVALRNELVGRHREVTLTVGEQTLTTQFLSKPTHTQFETWWKVAAGDTPLWIALDDFGIFSEVRQLIGNVEWRQLPEEVALVILETVFEDLLQDLCRRLDIPLEMVGPASGQSADQADIELGFTLQSQDGASAAGALRFGRELTDHVTRLASKMEALPAFDPSEVAVPTHVEIGRTVLTISELRKLRSFDVVLMDYTEYLDDGRVLVRCGSSLAFHGKVDQSCVILEDLVASADVGESLLASKGTDDLPCELRFELARLSVPFAEWTAIQPGHVLNLPPRPDDSVALVAGNVTLGCGDIVQIGDRLGVRLTSLDANLDTANPLEVE